MVAKGLSKAVPLLTTLLLLTYVQGVAAKASTGQPASPAAKVEVLVDGAYYPALLEKINAATQRIELVMYLWKTAPGERGKPAELVKALGAAKRRGVSVKVILENSGYDEELNRANQETARSLKREGIGVCFESPAVTTHAKLAIVDHRFCFVGSHNFTQSALGRNHEVSLLLDSPNLAEELSEYTATLLANN